MGALLISGPLLRIFQWRDFKGLQGKKEKWRSVPFGGSVGPSPENFCIFELSRLDFLQF